MDTIPICPSCSATNSAGAEYCLHCGAQLADTSHQTYKAESALGAHEAPVTYALQVVEDEPQYAKQASVAERYPESPVRIGTLLAESRVITEEQLTEALRVQHATVPRPRLGQVLITLKMATEEQVTVALARRLGIDYVDLDSKPLDMSLYSVVPLAFCTRALAVPFELDNAGGILLAMADPTDVVSADDLGVLTDRKIIPYAALPSAVQRGLARITGDKLAEIGSLEDEEGRSERLVDTLLSDAIRRKVSDLHIEAKPSKSLIRGRIDGKLQPVLSADLAIHPALVNRIKVLSSLDITERRRPQDGMMFQTIDGQRVSVRVSTMPSMFGENVVLRIVEEDGAITRLDSLGPTPQQLDIMHQMISGTQGLLLAAGPTGSGKTTTAYAALSEINDPEMNLVTLEDPVERELLAATQVQMNEKIGLTFPVALRSVMRQDPDVIMVGEIRDVATASITLQASLTGHIVVSTIHTNDAPATITRLLEMGAEAYLIGSALSVVVAQRLIRKLCTNCAQPVPAPRVEAAMFGVRLVPDGQWARAVGCPACSQTGYSGRLGIFEVMAITENIRDVIAPGVKEGDVYRAARAEGLMTLWEQGLSVVAQGLTTITEVGRALRGTRIPDELVLPEDA